MARSGSNRVGILALLIGVAWFLKLAYDNHWIRPSPLGKTITGLLVGAAVVLWSEWFRRKGYGAFSYSLKAVGTGTLYLTLWAAFHLFHLLPASVALLMMLAVTAWNGIMAWTQDAELLAAYALAGGFATPALLGSGGDHEMFLFLYVLAMDLMVLFLVVKKPWQRLLLGSFPGTLSYFIGWYAHYFTASAAGKTALFVVLLAAPFMAVPLIAKQRERVLEGLLTPLAAASFLALGLYSVLQDSGRHAWEPWGAVLLAAVYLLLMRMSRPAAEEGDESAAAPHDGLAQPVHLSVAIVLLTIAIPLKAEGRWITIGWLAEGVTLLWVSARLLGPTVQTRVRGVMRWLGCAALTLGVFGTYTLTGHAGLWTEGPVHVFWNARFVTQMLAVLALGASAWIAREAQKGEADAPVTRRGWPRIATVCTMAAHLMAAVTVVSEIDRYWNYMSTAADGTYRSVMNANCASAFLMVYGAGLLAWFVLRSTFQAKLQRWLGLVYLPVGWLWMLLAPAGGSSTGLHAIFNARLLLELIGAAALAVAVWVAWQARLRGEDMPWVKLAAGLVIAFNLLVLTAGVREIMLFFSASAGDAGLAESATVSGWLMVYAAALLAVGFWKRLAFIRWQGLILIVFTIVKVFLYDMRNLSSVYRVLSFIGLGVLLMGVSFAYQKDWLGLRDADLTPPSPPPAPVDTPEENTL